MDRSYMRIEKGNWFTLNKFNRKCLKFFRINHIYSVAFRNFMNRKDTMSSKSYVKFL